MSTAGTDCTVEKPGLSRHPHKVENAGSNPAGAPNLPKQIPGCLPQGYDQDSLLTVEQFALWRQLAVSTVRAMIPTMKGVLRRTREDVRIHVRTYLAANVK
jgi:hypothetical protein